MVDEVEHVDLVAPLAEALDAADALLQPRRIPGQVDVDQRSERLKVQAFAGGVGRDDEPDAPLLDGLLDLLALDALPLAVDEQAGFAGAGVDGDRLAGQRRGQALRRSISACRSTG